MSNKTTKYANIKRYEILTSYDFAGTKMGHVYPKMAILMRRVWGDLVIYKRGS